MAFVDGEAPLAVADHIRHCPSCGAEAADLSVLQGRLSTVLNRVDCPPTQLLGEYSLDLLVAEQRTAIAGHVLECVRCAAELQTLRAFLREEALAAAPEAGAMARLRRVVATLFVPTPSYAPGAVALRGAADATAQTYQAADMTITLGPGAQPRRGRASMMGLMVREAGDAEVPPGSIARLLAPSGAVESAEIDELGNFTFDDLHPGTFVLELQLADTVVVVEDVTVERR
jgi:hypothetical protein